LDKDGKVVQAQQITFEWLVASAWAQPKHIKSRETAMDLSSTPTSELAGRIAILRDNIRQITERAAAESGAADEERNANLLARQTEELDALLAEQQKRLAK
jgi:hypothetical protein